MSFISDMSIVIYIYIFIYPLPVISRPILTSADMIYNIYIYPLLVSTMEIVPHASLGSAFPLFALNIDKLCIQCL